MNLSHRIQKTKMVFFTILITVLSPLWGNMAQAQAIFPYESSGFFAGYPFMSAAFNILSWPVNFYYNPMWYGYSYYSYLNYQPRYATYASIAYSPKNDQFAFAYGLESRQEAVNSALSYCNSDDCKSVVWVQGGCAAVSTTLDSKILGWGVGPRKYDGINASIRSCQSQGHSACKMRSWVCSY